MHLIDHFSWRAEQLLYIKQSPTEIVCIYAGSLHTAAYSMAWLLRLIQQTTLQHFIEYAYISMKNQQFRLLELQLLFKLWLQNTWKKYFNISKNHKFWKSLLCLFISNGQSKWHMMSKFPPGLLRTSDKPLSKN